MWEPQPEHSKQLYKLQVYNFRYGAMLHQYKLRIPFCKYVGRMSTLKYVRSVTYPFC